MSSPDLEQVLEDAWKAPGNTTIELPPVDVNQVLHDHYEGVGDLAYTRTMLWDMEVRKASGRTSTSRPSSGRAASRSSRTPATTGSRTSPGCRTSVSGWTRRPTAR